MEAFLIQSASWANSSSDFGAKAAIHGLGTGVTAPWQLLENFRPGLPWILAGGLKPGNIDQALRQTHPDAIDIASGVEERPGIKSAEKVAAVMQSISKITSQ